MLRKLILASLIAGLPLVTQAEKPSGVSLIYRWCKDGQCVRVRERFSNMDACIVGFSKLIEDTKVSLENDQFAARPEDAACYPIVINRTGS